MTSEYWNVAVLMRQLQTTVARWRISGICFRIISWYRHGTRRTDSAF